MTVKTDQDLVVSRLSACGPLCPTRRGVHGPHVGGPWRRHVRGSPHVEDALSLSGAGVSPADLAIKYGESARFGARVLMTSFAIKNGPSEIETVLEAASAAPERYGRPGNPGGVGADRAPALRMCCDLGVVDNSRTLCAVAAIVRTAPIRVAGRRASWRTR